MSESAEAKVRGHDLRPSDVDFMPGLLRSLAVLLRLRGRTVSPNFLLASLGGGKVTPQGCLRAARQAGLEGRIAFRPKLADIPAPVLPCVLLLEGESSCVLTAFPEAEGGGKAEAEAIFPETGETAQRVSLEELESRYSGYALFAAVPAAPRWKETRLLGRRGKSWFWDVLRYYAPIYRHVALASVIINLIAVASPLFVMNVYDRVVPNNALETLWVLAAGILIIYAFNFILIFPALAFCGCGRPQRRYRAFQPAGGQGSFHAPGRQAGIHRRPGQQPARIRAAARVFQLLQPPRLH
jgi:ATP-binding cassette subfamily C protein LapB